MIEGNLTGKLAWGKDASLFVFWDLELVKSVLVNDFRSVKEWLYENVMIFNPNKCHYMCIDKSTESDIFKFENVCLENSLFIFSLFF